MTRLSIVIPVLGDPRHLEDTLLSVLENRPVDCEILVVHAGPYADPYDLGDEVRFVEAERGAGVAACVNRAVAASEAPVVHVLACGMEVDAGWCEVALEHFRDPDIGAVAPVTFDGDDRRKIVSQGLGYRPEGTVRHLRPTSAAGQTLASQHDLCGPDARAAFYRKSALELVGGFSAQVGDGLAGIDLALALRQADFRCVLEPRCMVWAHAAARCGESAFRYGCNVERLFWRWASAHGWLTSLAGHVALLIGQCAIGPWRPSVLVELAGRAWGMLRALFGKRRPKPADIAIAERPSVVVSPQLGKQDRSSRAA